MKYVNFKLNANMEAMVESLQQHLGYNSTPDVFREALRQMYKRQFPSYSGKPTPLPPTDGTSRASTVAKARVQNKTALKAEEQAHIIEMGQVGTRLLSGRAVGLGGDINEAGCVYSRMDNSPKTSEMTNPIFFVQMHDTGVFTSDEPIESNDRLQVFLLEAKFRDLKLDQEPEKIAKKLESIVTKMSLGIERGTVEAKDFSREVLTALLLRCDEHGVDTTELRKDFEESNFAV